MRTFTQPQIFTANLRENIDQQTFNVSCQLGGTSSRSCDVQKAGAATSMPGCHGKQLPTFSQCLLPFSWQHSMSDTKLTLSPKKGAICHQIERNLCDATTLLLRTALDLLLLRVDSPSNQMADPESTLSRSACLLNEHHDRLDKCAASDSDVNRDILFRRGANHDLKRQREVKNCLVELTARARSDKIKPPHLNYDLVPEDTSLASHAGIIRSVPRLDVSKLNAFQSGRTVQGGLKHLRMQNVAPYEKKSNRAQGLQKGRNTSETSAFQDQKMVGTKNFDRAHVSPEKIDMTVFNASTVPETTLTSKQVAADDDIFTKVSANEPPRTSEDMHHFGEVTRAKRRSEQIHQGFEIHKVQFSTTDFRSLFSFARHGKYKQVRIRAHSYFFSRSQIKGYIVLSKLYFSTIGGRTFEERLSC